MAIQYNAAGKIIPKRFSFARIEAAASHNGHGFCVACGAEAFEVEPDARGYPCERCEHKTVYGAEEIALRGWIKGEAA